jgi:hypothetical protein
MSIIGKTGKVAAKNALGKGNGNGGSDEKETEVKPTVTKDALKNAFPNAYAGNKFRTATKDKQSPVTTSVTGLSSAVAETNSILTVSIEVQSQQNAILTEILKAIKDGGMGGDGFDLSDLLDVGKKGKPKGARARAKAAKAGGRKGLGKSARTTKSANGILKSAKVLGKTVGKRIPILGGLIEGGMEYADSGNAGRAVSTGAGAIAGGFAGAEIGGLIGLLGGPAAPITVPVGAFIGAIVGGGVGAFAGKSGYDKLTGEGKGEGTGKDKKYTFEGVNYRADSIGYSAKEMFIKVTKLTIKGSLTASLGAIVNTDGTGGAGGNIPEYNGPGVAMKGSAKEAFDFFVAKGWTKEQAVGIVSNLEAESNFRTNAVGDGGKAYGIAQWHPDRQANFYKAFGKDIREANFNEQLDFVNWELNNTEKRAGDLLRKATTPGHAAQIIDATYERSLAGMQGNSSGRIVSAQKMFKGIETDKSYAEGSTTGSSGSLPSGDIVALGKSLQGQGVNVSENPAFGGVKPVHQGRGHYEGRAIDVNGPPGMVEADDPVWGPKFDQIAANARASGYNVIWRAPGHFNHMHIEAPSSQMAERPQSSQRVATSEPQPPQQQASVASLNIVPKVKVPLTATPEAPEAPTGASSSPKASSGGQPQARSGGNGSAPANNGVRTAEGLLDSISMLKIMFAA